MMSDKNINSDSNGVEILASVVIQCSNVNNETKIENNDNDNASSTQEIVATKSSEQLTSCEKDISEIVKLVDPISPATAVPRNNVDLPSDDGAPKLILNLVSSSQYKNDAEEKDKKIAQDQLDELKTQSSRGKRRKNKNVQQNNELYNEDLVTILESGNDGHYEIVNMSSEDNELQEKKKIDEDESKKIQKRGRKRKSPLEPVTEKTSSPIISSISNDWSENNEKNSDSVEISKLPANKKKPEIKIEEIKIISEQNKPRRIIKKKIIWDPDAPETHFPLSSLVHQAVKLQNQPLKNTNITSVVHSVAPKKQEQNVTKTKLVTKVESKTDASTNVDVVVPKRQYQTPVVLNNKKRKLTETDKSTNDEEAPVSTTNKSASTEKKLPFKRGITIKKANASGKPVLKETISSPRKEAVAASKRETPTLKKQNTAPALQTTGTRKTKATIEENVVLPRKRIPKPKKDNWDFVYNQRNMDSMIIRRRSSSYSSTTSPRRLSLEHAPTPAATSSTKSKAANALETALTAVANKKSNAAGKTKGNTAFIFVKPGTKQTAVKKGTHDEKIVDSESNVKKVVPTTSPRELSRKSPRNLTASTNNTEIEETKSGDNLTDDSNKVEIKKHGNVVQLIVYPKYDDIRYTFSIEILKSLTKNLETLLKDNSCKVVVITSEGPHFCQGIDTAAILNTNGEKRKSISQDMAKCVSNFLKALACFTKPLIAGIHGSCNGLGVTMLPLFDIIISSDKSTFETMYAKIGQIPEGYCILSLTNNVRHNFKTKLLWLCEKMNPTEAALSGLVTRLTSGKVQDDAINCANRISSFSLQTFLSMKSQRFKNELSKLLNVLDNEEKILANHWASVECQEKFKTILEQKEP